MLANPSLRAPLALRRSFPKLLAGFLVILVASIIPTAAAAGPILVQHGSKDAGTTLSSSLAFPSNNTAGNWIGVVIRAGQSGQVFSVSDTQGNVYQKAVQFNQTLDAPNGDTFAIFYAENIVGGANSVTVSDTIANKTLRLAILEYSGLATVNSLDMPAGLAAQGNGSSPNSGTVTTTGGGDLILGAVMTGSGVTYTAGSGFTIEERISAAPNTKLIVEDQIQSAAGGVAASATLSSNASWGAAVAAFKAAAGVGSTSPTITGLNPTSGAVNTPVTITGTNFSTPQGTSTVTFNGTTVTPTSWSPTSISVRVPAIAIGNATVIVTVGGLASNAASFTVTTPTPTSVTATAGTPQNATVNAAFGTTLQATVKDSLNNLVSGVTVTFAAPTSGASGTFAGGTNTAVTNPQGVATAAIFTANGTAGGPYNVTASVAGVAAPANFSLTNLAGAPASVAATAGTSQSATINAAFGTALQAVVRDSLSNPVNGMTVTFAAPPSGASGTFAGGTNTAVTNTQGVATAAIFTANGTAGGPYNVTASVAGVATQATFSLTNLASTPTSIAATAGTPQSATVGTAMGTQLQATVNDSLNNPVSGVTVTFAAPTSGASGTFAGGTNTAVTNPQGVATAAIFTANGTAGGPYNVTASVAGVATPANFSLTNLAGAPASVAATAGTPQSATVGTAMGTQLQATVNDSLNNPVSGVTVTFAAPTSGASGTFAGGVNTAVTNTQGVATAAIFTANGTAGGPYNVTASVAGVATPASFSLSNLAPTTGVITLVQHASKDAGTTTSASLVFPLNNTAGNWIGVVIRAGQSGQVFTVSDTGKNTYRQAVLFNQTLDAPNGDTFAIFYAENIAGGANTVTVSDSIANKTLRFAISEYSGVATANSLDAKAAAQGNGTSANSGTATSTAGGDLILGAVMTGGGVTYTAGSGFTIEERIPAAPNTKLIVQDQIQQSAGVISTNAAWAQATSWGAALAAFNPIGGGGTGPNIGNLSPTSGATGTPVTIIGSNFGTIQGSSTVTFGGTGAGPASSWSATSISVLVPTAAATGNVVVTVGGVPSNGINFTVQNSLTVAVVPKRSAIHVSQTQQFTVTVTNDPQNAGVTWAVDGAIGGNPSTGTITASGLFVPGAQLGLHAVTATSITNSTVTTSVTVSVTDLPGVFTYHNDSSRSGQIVKEFALTPSLVKTATFGKLFSCTVDGSVYAQPLWVPNVSISGVSHNLLIVATAHDTLYAFDAEANPCSTLWHVNLIDANHGGTTGETTVPSGRTGNLVGSGAGDITPEVGVIGTPVIDPSTNTLYTVSKSVIASSLSFFQRLHAIDLTTGDEKFNGPMSITAAITVPGTGDGAVSGRVPFDVRNQNQRAGLALANGNIYISWGSHEDQDPWHGWSMAFNASTLAFVSAYCTTSNTKHGGIWMGGGAPAIDAGNNLYLLTGNGNWDGVSQFGDSFLRLTSSLSVADWFTPSDQATLNGSDLDLGSGGAVILVDQPSAPFPRLVLGGGKQGSGTPGEIFVLNRDSMGHNSSSDSGVVQRFSAGGQLYSTGAFWQNTLFVAAVGAPLKAFSFDTVNGLFNTSSVVQTSNTFGFPGASPSVSSAGATNGIVWAIDNTLYCTPQSPGCGPAVLHAYDATNVHNELWNSSQAGGNRDQAGNPIKFTVPTVANGKVYIGTQTELDVYGLLQN